MWLGNVDWVSQMHVDKKLPYLQACTVQGLYYSKLIQGQSRRLDHPVKELWKDCYIWRSGYCWLARSAQPPPFPVLSSCSSSLLYFSSFFIPFLSYPVSLLRGRGDGESDKSSADDSPKYQGVQIALWKQEAWLTQTVLFSTHSNQNPLWARE